MRGEAPPEGITMDLVFLVSGLFFGGDVARLGDPAFHVRHSANERLRAASWAAYPALLRGSQSPNAERAVRAADLLDALDGPFWTLVEAEGIARGVNPLPETASATLLRAACERAQALGGWDGDLWGWVQSRPYTAGSLWGDADHAIRKAAKARASAPARLPKLMPGFAGGCND